MPDEVRNISDLLARCAVAAPDKPFLFSESDGRQFTYAEFAASVNLAARMLAAQGVAKGDVVSLLMPNSAEYIISYFACWSLGALAGPVNSLLKEHEIEFVMNNSEAKAILVHSEFLERVENIRIRLPHLRSIIIFDNEAEATSEFRQDCEPDVRPPGIIQSDDAIIIYTSGTTGKPKGCLLTHGNVIANARQISEWLHFTEEDRLLTIMPLFHMNAVSVTTMSALYAGGSTVISPRFSASQFWNIISDYQVTSFGSVATMLSMLLSTYPDGVPAGLKTTRLRFAMCGSAPVPAEVMKKFEETFKCPVIEGYGLSESTCRSKDGFFYIVDRKTDMIIRGGENIYPREIDEVLYQHPAVAAAATIGVPDPLYGEEVAAFIVLKDGAKIAEQDLIDHCRKDLADYKCPKTIHIVTDIPKGPTGKLLKRELAETFRDRLRN